MGQLTGSILPIQYNPTTRTVCFGIPRDILDYVSEGSYLTAVVGGTALFGQVQFGLALCDRARIIEDAQMSRKLADEIVSVDEMAGPMLWIAVDIDFHTRRKLYDGAMARCSFSCLGEERPALLGELFIARIRPTEGLTSEQAADDLAVAMRCLSNSNT